MTLRQLAALALLAAWLALPVGAAADTQAPHDLPVRGCTAYELCSAQGIAGVCATAGFVFVDDDVDATENTIAEAAHGLATGTGPVRISKSAGAFPAPLSGTADYWVIASAAGTIQLATSRANALAGTAVDLTTVGDDAVDYTLRGDEIVADLTGHRATTVYASSSTASTFSCTLQSNLAGYDAGAAGLHVVSSEPLTATERVQVLPFPLEKLLAECSAINADGVVHVTAIACE
jgi:hypothetical protein